MRDIVLLRASSLAAHARLLPAGGLVALGPPLSGLPGGALELLVTIPMAGMVESLNVSCCAAVMVAEAVRQRAAAGAKTYAATAAEAEEALRRMEAANARS